MRYVRVQTVWIERIRQAPGSAAPERLTLQAATDGASSRAADYTGLMTETPPTKPPLSPLRERLKLPDIGSTSLTSTSARSLCSPATVRTTARLGARGSRSTNSLKFSLQGSSHPRSSEARRIAANIGKLPELFATKTPPARHNQNLGGRRSRSATCLAAASVVSAAIAGGASSLSVTMTCGAMTSSGFAAAGCVVRSVALATTTGVALAA